MGGRVGRPGSENKQHVAEFDKGQSRDIAAEAVGMSGEHYRRAKAVVDFMPKSAVRTAFAQNMTRATGEALQMTYTQEERGQIAEEYRARFGKYPPLLFELVENVTIGLAEKAIKRGSPINSEDMKEAYAEHGVTPDRSY